MSYKFKIDVEKDTFQDIADSLTKYLQEVNSYKGTAQDIKHNLSYHIESSTKTGNTYEEVYVMKRHDGVALKYNEVEVILTFKVKDTGKTTRVSKLRKMKIYEFDKVVVKEAYISIWLGDFKTGENKYEVINNGSWGSEEEASTLKGKDLNKLSFKSAKTKGIEDMLVRKNTTLREIVIKNMAQPWLKIANFNQPTPDDSQKHWDNILQEVERINSELISKQISKINGK